MQSSSTVVCILEKMSLIKHSAFKSFMSFLYEHITHAKLMNAAFQRLQTRDIISGGALFLFLHFVNGYEKLM